MQNWISNNKIYKSTCTTSSSFSAGFVSAAMMIPPNWMFFTGLYLQFLTYSNTTKLNFNLDPSGITRVLSCKRTTRQGFSMRCVDGSGSAFLNIFYWNESYKITNKVENVRIISIYKILVQIWSISSAKIFAIFML